MWTRATLKSIDHHPSEKSDAAILSTGTRTKNSSAEEEEERKEQNDPGRRFAI